MTQKLKILWNDAAATLLENRDLYERRAIRSEFARDPYQDAIEFDPGGHGFLTPVSNGRFHVIWQKDEARNEALVLAALPLTGISDETPKDDLKAYVERAIRHESKGRITYPR